MTIQELHARFPVIHELFVDSPEFTPPTEGNISGTLVRFLAEHGFKVLTSHTPPPSKRSRKTINYVGILIIHGRTIDLEDRAFTSLDAAVEHYLDYALDMFTEEQKITA